MGVGEGPAELVELGEHRRRQTEHLADVAHRTAELVGGERGNDRRMLLAEVGVDPLEQHVADVPRKVEVDIGQGVQLLVEEAFEVELVLHRVDVGETDEVADDGADG